MRIPLDNDNPKPLYKQIVDFLEREIKEGLLIKGQKLPSTRQMAESLGINRITVSTAYSELESKGLVFSLQGSGTFVGGPLGSAPEDKKDRGSRTSSVWKKWAEETSWESVQKNFSETFSPEGDLLINFASGTSDPKLFPLSDFRKALQTVLVQDGVESLGYGDRWGYLPFRETIASILSTQGIPARAKEILITSGAQQAAYLIAKAFLRPGDLVVTEALTYSGIIDLFRSFGARILTLPGNGEQGFVSSLEELLKKERIKFLYLIPNFNNPSGRCMSGEARRRILALALKYSTPIVEDDYVGDFRYDGKELPALKALDSDGWVIYIRTFSKILVPGLRTGFMVAETPVLNRLAQEKRVQDLSGCELIHRALTQFITVGRYNAHLRKSLRIYRRRRDCMVEALKRFMPGQVTWNIPEGGLFLWLDLGKNLDGEILLREALKRSVGFAPGSLFDPDSKIRTKIRLNFSAVNEEEIERGIKILGKIVSDYIG